MIWFELGAKEDPEKKVEYFRNTGKAKTEIRGRLDRAWECLCRYGESMKKPWDATTMPFRSARDIEKQSTTRRIWKKR